MVLYTIQYLHNELKKYYGYQSILDERNDAIQYLLDVLKYIGYYENETYLFEEDPVFFDISELPDYIINELEQHNIVYYDDQNNVLYVKQPNEFIYCYTVGHYDHFFWILNRYIDTFFDILERILINELMINNMSSMSLH
jgi:hypothetical protein